VPRWMENGERNAIEIKRLKDKMGDWSNASSEIEYHGAQARLVGEEGHGIRAIMAMVHHTRLDCIIAPAAYMRQAVANALWHTSHRTAYQKHLIDQPLMRSVLADLVVESEAATALAFRIAHSFDESATDSEASLFARIATPVGKYWLNKRVVPFVAEAIEAHGGAGYIEEGLMPRLYRQAPLNSIWEGSGNIVCLDVLRALGRQPQAAGALLAELEAARGASKLLDRRIEMVKEEFGASAGETGARRLVEYIALALQGCILARTAPPSVFDAFCVLKLTDAGTRSYGAAAAKIDVDAILSRAMPA
jgi:putative acyl-CoA dehydrogenase